MEQPHAHVDTTLPEPESLNRRQKIKKQFRKIVKEDSSLSILKVSGTALTAVSVALISTQLTSVLNSLALVAMVSILSAVFNEFYRVVLSVTSLGAKKVIAPIVMTNADGSITEIPAVESVSPTPVQTPAVPIEQGPQSNVKRGPIAAIHNYFKSNPAMRMALLFTVISAVTITANYFVASSTEKVESITNYTTVQENPVKELSEEEKQLIIDHAVGAASYNSETQKDDLQTQLDAVHKENAELKDTVERLSQQQEEYMRALTEMQKRLETVEQSEATPVESNTPQDPQVSSPPQEVKPVPTPQSTVQPQNAVPGPSVGLQ